MAGGEAGGEAEGKRGGEVLMKYFRNPSHFSLYSSSDAAKENSFNNQKLPKLRLFSLFL